MSHIVLYQRRNHFNGLLRICACRNSRASRRTAKRRLAALTLKRRLSCP